MRSDTPKYQELVKQGMCIDCRKEPVSVTGGKKLRRCKECNTKLSEHQANLYWKRTGENTCRRCDDDPLPDQTLCEMHHNMAKAHRDAYRERHSHEAV